MNYEAQARKFAKDTGTKMQIVDTAYGKHFSDDKQSRHRFKIKLTRNRKSYTFWFGQSIAAGNQEPAMYDVLTCLTKYDPYTFEDFCGDYGYDEDSRTAERIYKAVCKEWRAVERLFSDVLDKLQEIQ